MIFNNTITSSARPGRRGFQTAARPACFTSLFQQQMHSPAHQTAFSPLKLRRRRSNLWRFGNNLAGFKHFAGIVARPQFHGSSGRLSSARGSGRPACRLPTSFVANNRGSVLRPALRWYGGALTDTAPAPPKTLHAASARATPLAIMPMPQGL